MAKPLLYEALAQKLMEAINSGRHPVGSLLPGEIELAEREGVSRHTVRAALKKLEQYGFIKRTPHVGTRVLSRGKLFSIDQQLSTISDLDRLAGHNRRRLLEVREITVDADLAERIHCPAGERLLRFTMVREGAKPGERPICWTAEYVTPAWRELIALSKAHPDVLMIELICSHLGQRCAEVRQTIEATMLRDDPAERLMAVPGSPCLRIYRRYVNEHGRTLLTTVSYHPSDRYAFNLNMRLE